MAFYHAINGVSVAEIQLNGIFVNRNPTEREHCKTIK